MSRFKKPMYYYYGYIRLPKLEGHPALVSVELTLILNERHPSFGKPIWKYTLSEEWQR